MKNINLSIASLSIPFLTATIFNELQLAIIRTSITHGPIAQFFIGLFGFIGKGLLIMFFVYVVYQACLRIKFYHVLFEVPRLVLRTLGFISGLLMATVGVNIQHTMYGIYLCMFGVSIVLFLFWKWSWDLFEAYRDLFRRRIIRR